MRVLENNQKFPMEKEKIQSNQHRSATHDSGPLRKRCSGAFRRRNRRSQFSGLRRSLIPFGTHLLKTSSEGSGFNFFVNARPEFTVLLQSQWWHSIAPEPLP